MKSNKIQTQKDLNLFLNILAEEAVKKAYLDESLSEKDDNSSLFAKDGEEEDGDKEVDLGGDDTSVDLDVGGMEEPEQQTQQSQPEKQKKVDIRPTPLTLELGEPTSDGLIAAFNMIRGGRSFKEPDVATQLRKYFDEQLNDKERLALATFLSGVRDIVGGTPAGEAVEPGDENISIEVSGDEQKNSDQGQNVQQQPQQQAQPQQQQPGMGMRQASPSMAQQSSQNVEDTTPPIKVGSRDERDRELEESFRRQIRSILS